MKGCVPASAVKTAHELQRATGEFGTFRAASVAAQAFDPDHSKAWAIVRRLKLSLPSEQG